MKEIQLELVSSPGGASIEPTRLAINRGRAALGLPEVSRALWDWRLANPGGAHLGIARDGSGTVLAAVLGLEHRALLAGESTGFMELVEVFHDARACAGLERPRALADLCAAFTAAHGGRAPEGLPLFYGWPTRRAHRYLLFQQKAEVLRSEEFLRADPLALKRLIKPLAPDLELELVQRFPAHMGALFERFAEGREALLMRDDRRLNWRFAEHPEREYRLALVRRGGELQGYAVQREGEQGQAILADCVASPLDLDVINALLSWAAERTLSDGQHFLTYGVSTWSPEYRHLQGLGFHACEGPSMMLIQSFQKPFIMSWLFHNWFYSFGDLEGS